MPVDPSSDPSQDYRTPLLFGSATGGRTSDSVSVVILPVGLLTQSTRRLTGVNAAKAIANAFEICRWPRQADGIWPGTLTTGYGLTNEPSSKNCSGID